MPVSSIVAPTVRDGFSVNTDQCDTTGAQWANNEGRKATYHAVTSGVVMTANGVMFVLKGSATKLVRVTRVYCGGLLTTGATVTTQVQRTTADVTSPSGAVTITPTPLWSGNPAATAVAKSYTTATLGTGNTLVSTDRGYYVAAATSGLRNAEFLFGGRNSQSLILSGIAEFMQVTFNTSSYTGAAFDIEVEFTEENAAGT